MPALVHDVAGPDAGVVLGGADLGHRDRATLHRRWRWVWPLVISVSGMDSPDGVEEPHRPGRRHAPRPAFGRMMRPAADGAWRSAHRPVRSRTAAMAVAGRWVRTCPDGCRAAVESTSTSRSPGRSSDPRPPPVATREPRGAQHRFDGAARAEIVVAGQHVDGIPRRIGHQTPEGCPVPGVGPVGDVALHHQPLRPATACRSTMAAARAHRMAPARPDGLLRGWCDGSRTRSIRGVGR